MERKMKIKFFLFISYKDLMWRGNVSRAISPDQKRHNLDKAMAKLLKNYPAKSKK
jgi:hypothetical protein